MRDMFGIACGGAAAGVANSFLLTPVELVKIRLQTQSQSGVSSRGPLDVARAIIRHHGPIGLYRGWAITALRDGERRREIALC